MANTVTTLDNGNTFGHWLVSTNALIAENNILAKDNYVKDSGTIYLSEGTLDALQSNGNVIVQKVLSVRGAGSSAIIQNDLTVERQGLFTNTETSISATSNVEVGNILTVMGLGYGLQVDNDAKVDGDLYVGGNLDLNILEAREKVNTAILSVTGSTYTDKLQSNNQVVTDVLTSNSSIYTSRLQSNTSITTTEIQANTVVNAAAFSATTGIYGNILQANSSVNTTNASIVNTLFADVVQANSSVNTSTISAANTIYTKELVANSNISATDVYVSSNVNIGTNLNTTRQIHGNNIFARANVYSDLLYSNTAYFQNNVATVGNTNSTSFFASSNVTTPTLYSVDMFSDYITANTHIYTPSIDVEGITLTRFVQANSSTNTSNSSVVNTSWTKFLVANTLVTTLGLNSTGKTHTNTLQANASINTEVLSVGQRALIERVQANTSVNTDTLSATTLIYANKLQANSTVNTQTVSVTGNVYTNRVDANTYIKTPTIEVTDKIDANSASVFVNNLETLGSLSVGSDFIINGTTIYNSDTFTLNANQSEGQFAYLTVNRGQTGSNAEIRWNESSEYWDIYDVHVGNYNRILTYKEITDSLTSTNPLTLASSLAANTLNDKVQTANNHFTARADSSDRFANGAFLRANSSYTAQNTTASFANAAFRHANAAYASANNVAPQVAPAYAQANAAFDKANSVVSTIRGTNGFASASSAGITLKSNNGVVIFATNDGSTGNTLSISTPQDLRTTSSPTFAGLSLTTPLGEAQGGTGTTSYASLFGLAISAAAGAGAAGKVLGTDGAGSYLWVTGGSGGGGSGAQPGSRINSVRLSYTGDSTTAKFTTPTFTAATQLRPYINGVRQMESEYTAWTSNSKIQFTTPPVTGDKVLIEVDGYAVYEYFANNIVYGPATGDMVGATIQDAIDNLESRKIAKIGGAFTGVVTGLTYATNVANTAFATTKFVSDFANASYTFAHSISGNAGSVTNGVYANQTYDNPSWLNTIAPSKLNAVIPDDKLADKVTAGAHGSTANTISLTVDAKGRVTAISNAAISITKDQISNFPTLATSATTDTTNAGNISSGTLPNARLADTAVTAGSYGGSNKVATFTVDSKGRLTAASDQQISITVSQISNFPTIPDTANASNITTGTLADARLTANVILKTGGSFTGDTTVTGTGKITLSSSGDITAYRTGDTTGAVFLNKTQTRYLFNNGTKYELPGQGLLINASNALTEAGDFTITGSRFYIADGTTDTAGQSGTLVVTGNNAKAGWNNATMSFFRPQIITGGVVTSAMYGVNMGLDKDNVFRIGGYSMSANRFQMDASGNLTMAGNVTAYSDERLKTNIQTIENALDKVSKLRGVSYERIDNGEKNIGVIAQEIKEVLPEVVMEREGENQYMSVSYGNIVGVLIEAIKELKAEIEELKGQNK